MQRPMLLIREEKVARRPFSARKNGPISRFITDEKSISNETQQGPFILHLIKWVGAWGGASADDQENY